MASIIALKDYLHIWWEKVNNIKSNETLNLYIDFPFCRSCCKYCVYNSLPYYKNIDRINDYENFVVNLLKLFAHMFEVRTPDTIYFGGGTASLWSDMSLGKIKHTIINYEKIKFKKTEAHPIDLSDERIYFYKKEMGINVISIGVQSFDKEANAGQKRVYVNSERIQHIVELCHDLGIYVNIDLVALFNGDNQRNWDVFQRDMEIVCEQIRPDSLDVNPNFRTQLDYTEQVLKLREIIKKFCQTPYIYNANESVLSQERQIVKAYGTNGHYLLTPNFLAYCREGNFHSCSGPQYRKQNQNTLGFGGVGQHYVYSYTSNGEVSYLSYNFEKKDVDIVHQCNS